MCVAVQSVDPCLAEETGAEISRKDPFVGSGEFEFGECGDGADVWSVGGESQDLGFSSGVAGAGGIGMSDPVAWGRPVVFEAGSGSVAGEFSDVGGGIVD